MIGSTCILEHYDVTVTHTQLPKLQCPLVTVGRNLLLQTLTVHLHVPSGACMVASHLQVPFLK